MMRWQRHCQLLDSAAVKLVCVGQRIWLKFVWWFGNDGVPFGSLACYCRLISHWPTNRTAVSGFCCQVGTARYLGGQQYSRFRFIPKHSGTRPVNPKHTIHTVPSALQRGAVAKLPITDVSARFLLASRSQGLLVLLDQLSQRSSVPVRHYLVFRIWRAARALRWQRQCEILCADKHSMLSMHNSGC